MIIFTSVIDFLVVEYMTDTSVLDKLIQIYSIIGFVISLLLVFRTNTAYDRWWEGRKKWGAYVNDTRNLATKLASHNLSREDQDFYKRMIPNFIYASKEHLRNGVKFEEFNLTEEEKRILERKGHVPSYMVRMMHERILKAHKNGEISGESYLAIDKNMNALLDSLGACERIKNTPIPFSYSLFIKKFIFIYVTTLPLAFVTTFGYASSLIATFVFYVLVSMEVLAEEIEDPFGVDDNDLPTDELSGKIDKTVQEIFEA